MNRPRGSAPQPNGMHAHVRSDAARVPFARTLDGRNIDPALGDLGGEAGKVESHHPDKARSLGKETLGRVRGESDAEAYAHPTTTYYEQPVLKAPVWKAPIPIYFFTGGLAGGCLALGAAAQLVGGRKLRRIVVPARLIATGALAVSAGLLIEDLGRPARFFNMLRVFRPTSPMNMGTWILSGAGATAGAATVLPFLGAPRLADAAGVAAGVFGLGLASYTSVLLSNTAVPAWQHGGRTLPPLFVASAAASAAAALDLAGIESPVIDAFGTVAKCGELVASLAYERSLAKAGPSVVKHLRKGKAGALLRASQALSASSVAASLLRQRRLSGALGLAGALAMRFAVMQAGRASSMDPRATFEPQRARSSDAAK